MMNYNNKMKEVLGTHLELMIKDRGFDHCSWVEEDQRSSILYNKA